MTQENSNIDDRKLSIIRILNAPLALVYKVFTDPDHIKNWWGPNGFTNTIFKMDMRAGGDWDFIMHGPDGTDYKNHNVFREVIQNEKIVYDHVNAPIHQTTITFTPQGDKTLLKMQLVFETAAVKDSSVKTHQADQGLIDNIDKLEVYLRSI